jgi:RHH-type rel operon transcriptional repressor/antitoxin RelB
MNVILPPNIEKRLQLIADSLGKDKNQIIEDAIINFLEDLEDIQDAEESLQEPLESYLTIEEMEKRLGLED